MKQRVIQAPGMPLASWPSQPARDGGESTPSPALPTSVESSQIIKIPLSRLRIHPFNSRAERPQERIEEVRDMLIGQNTQREAITVVPGRRPDDAGHFYILSGQTRFHSANLAGWTELDARINADIDPDDHLAFLSASIEHNTGRPETDWDLAVKAKALADEGVELARIQKAINRNERALRRLLTIMDLPQGIQDLVRQAPNKLTGHACELIAKAVMKLGADEATAFANDVARDGLSQRELEHRIDRAVRRQEKANNGGTQRRTRLTARPIMVGATKAGELKVLASKTAGQRLITLTADLPEHLVQRFTTDIESALAKLASSPNER